MCGIAGVLRLGEPADDTAVVLAMTAQLERRGPDDEGVVHDGAVTLGNRRLAILDLSEAGHQPMRSDDGRYLISFNGEIYNHDELRRDMGLARDQLRSTSDTEILLRAWQRWGEGALQRMVGQWAFAVYDREERRLWLSRDRFGEKPLFYHRDGDTLAFASSIGALLQAPWVPREIDRDALAEYVTMRYVVSPRTILSGVEKLPGGHTLSVGPDGAELERWYEPRFRPRSGIERRAAVEEFDALFARACKRCLVSDVPVALLLSDGIDSNSIRASLSRGGHDVPSFTYKVTSTASGLAPTDTQTMDLRVTAEDRLATMVPAFASFSEPTGDGAALATWLLIRNARERATVFLCGHGGDEVLGGYRLSQDRFRLAVLRRFARLPLALTGKALDRHLYGSEPLTVRRRRLLEEPPRRTPQAARYIIHRPLPVPDIRELFGVGTTATAGYLASVERLYAQGDDAATDLDRMQEVMLQTFLTENICCFADSMAMDSSAELRMPFLDRDLVDFALSLPPGMRVSRWPGRTNTKLILRWWGRGRVPQEVLGLRKRAFPFGNLPALLRSHRGELRGLVLGARAVRRELPGVERWLERDAESFRGPWEGTLWALLSLAIWCEHVGVR